ncbi:MAG TPA: aminopeptidase P family protein [Acidimicrobiales bacterium]|nr:aminopeptidase P family protein [Acidimicrobiales bacterium]
MTFDARAARVARSERVRARMRETGVEALLLSLGADLPWLSGYEAMPLERLTMLVLPADGEATMVVPRLEAPRVPEDADLFRLRPWEETEDPVAVVAGLVGSRTRLAVSDRAWSAHLLALQAELPRARWSAASSVTSELRAVKDPAEVAALRAAARAADRVAAQLQAGDLPLVGRTEAEVSRELGDRLKAEGHSRVNFAIVGSGPNSASPHHEPGPRVIGEGEVVVCDFGGVLAIDDGPGYCSDITRTVVTGDPSAEVSELYAVLHEAQSRGVGAAVVGRPCSSVDAAARSVIDAAGLGEWFIHRTGHGIGLEEHEDPYLVEGNDAPLAAGHAFSVEPGIYLAGRFGARLEDIVVATASGPEALNVADHHLAVVG